VTCVRSGTYSTSGVGPSPHVPVEIFRHRRFLERPFTAARRQPHVDFLDLAEPSIANEFARQSKVSIAALLTSRLKDALRFLLRFNESFAFVDRQRQRFFAIDILAGSHRGERTSVCQ
jgi:hypothetical protein